MLHRLARLADDGSDESLFAHLHLAELLVERDPWRAALYARRVLAHRPDDDRGWATLALCQTLLGNYRFAVSAYHHALTSAPKNPWYAHNLGHLLDVALGRARDADRLAAAAPTRARPYSGEVAASYAHALARVGRLAEARKVLDARHEAHARPASTRRCSSGSSRAPRPTRTTRSRAPRPSTPSPRATATTATTPPAPRSRAKRDDAPSRAPDPASPVWRSSTAVLARGLASLPLDAKQRARAKALARDAARVLLAPRAGARGGAARAGRGRRRGLRHRLRRPRAPHAGRGGGVLPGQRREPPRAGSASCAPTSICSPATRGTPRSSARRSSIFGPLRGEGMRWGGRARFRVHTARHLS